ncbi:peroxisome assembly protein 12-like [Galleria mellonella]|uniref:Peroxisome assembly protein 12 n=1 Tax=Galleria mellonella TaxID=7137 RepID=A0ABM3MBZ9_GALME|nr:peroxisome assembly protein 12-like [Galleria mellonella]
MAVYAAHLTRTLQGTPSIFQVTAQEALGTTVKPALRKLIEYLAEVYPDKCGWCVPWYDELYLLFDCCLQYHYLKHYAASFSESFYGLLRVPTTVSSEFNPGNLRLPEMLEYGSVALLVLVPYIKDKMEKIVDRWREDDEDGRLGKSKPDRARKAAIKIYAIVHLVAKSARLVQAARYMTGATRSHCPELALLGVSLRDAPLLHRDTYTWTGFFKNLLTGQFRGAAVSFPMVGGAVLRGVQYGAFVVQLLRWWDARAASHAALQPPPAPQPDERAVRWKNKCPICLQTWKIPTVLPVSGYIFCYVCISRHVRARATCPVTRCPAAESSLVRLYVD